MATTFKTPGVYITEKPAFPPSVAQVETAIPAFIGYTEKHEFNAAEPDKLKLIPVRVSSLLEYEELFGGPHAESKIAIKITDTVEEFDQVADPKAPTANEIILPNLAKRSVHTMYYALQAFFANGGGPCWIVSVGKYQDGGNDAHGKVIVGEEETTDPKKVGLLTGLKRIANEDEPTLIVFPEAQNLPLSKVTGEENPTLPTAQLSLYVKALSQCNELKDRFLIADFHHSGEGLTTAGEVQKQADVFRALASENLKYGAAYFPNIQTLVAYHLDEKTIEVVHKRTGPTSKTNPTPKEYDGPFKGKLSAIETSNGASFRRVKDVLEALPVTIPPSGAMAGVYARVDRTRGVWKAPANTGLSFVSGFTFAVTDAIQDFLNVDPSGKSIDALRAFPTLGNLVWGARTLDGNSNDWRYVPVRRFFNMVEESTKKASRRFVFEPNDANTWVKVRAMIENFLLLQWRAGALQGAKPEQAFYVKVGFPETMSQLDINEGRMKVEIGMAVVRPAEFIILEFTHKMLEA